MISGLRCQNYRSLEDIEVPLASLIAVVGPNGAGKTVLLQAIDLVLGAAWPSVRSLRIPQDFTGFGATRSLVVKIAFDPPLGRSAPSWRCTRPTGAHSAVAACSGPLATIGLRRQTNLAARPGGSEQREIATCALALLLPADQRALVGPFPSPVQTVSIPSTPHQQAS
jgi:energy-coupling factor transporter ATP-binding protein EcfA2